MGVEINEEKGDKLDKILEKFQFRKAISHSMGNEIYRELQFQEERTHKWSSNYTRDQRPCITFLDKESSV